MEPYSETFAYSNLWVGKTLERLRTSDNSSAFHPYSSLANCRLVTEKTCEGTCEK